MSNYELSGTGVAQYIDCRLFLEGVEVPVISASVTANLNSPASASIQIIPEDSLATFQARTVVHLFYLDTDSYVGSGDQRPADRHYKLMFCGEVFSTALSKSGSGARSCTLSCLDFSNVWDTNYSYILRYGQDANQTGGAIVANQGVFLGAGSNTSNPFDDIVSSPAMVVRRFSSATPGHPNINGTGNSCLGGLLSILELLSGVQGLYFGVNPWATVTERRTRVLESIITDSGEVAAALYDQQVFADWLQNKTGHAGSVISFRQIVDMILGYVYYDFVPNPTPYYTRGSDGSGNPGRHTPAYRVEEGSATGSALMTTLTETFGVSAKIGGLREEFAEKCVEVLTKLKESNIKDTVSQVEGVLSRGWAVTSAYREVDDRMRISKVTRAKAIEMRPDYAHDNGFAMDISLVKRSTYNCGNHPWRLSTDSTNVIGLQPDGSNSSHILRRWRHALWYLQGVEGGALYNQAVTEDVDAVAALIMNNRSSMAGFGGQNEAGNAKLESDVVFIKEAMVPFYNKLEEILDEVGGLSWGGSWTNRKCPFYNMMGIGWDPVHFQLAGWKGKMDEPTIGGVSAPTITVSDGRERERLHSFIFRPNIWFAAPPRCNVMFPDDIENFSYQRQMMRETTRLQLDSYNQFYESAIVNQYYFAPQFEEGSSLEIGGIGSVSKLIVYEHEKFSGIIPKMERISEISFYAKQEGGRQDLRYNTDNQVIGGMDSSGQNVSAVVENEAGTDSKKTLEDYAQQVAHFNLLTHRYDSRTGSFSARFLPRLAVGFPAVIIDKPLNQAQVDGSDVKVETRPIPLGETRPVHWLGMIDSLTHTINQSGARSSGSLKYVRSHRTGDETDDLFCENLTDQAKLAIQDTSFKIDTGDQLYNLAETAWASDGTTGTDDWMMQRLVASTMGLPTSAGLVATCHAWGSLQAQTKGEWAQQLSSSALGRGIENQATSQTRRPVPSDQKGFTGRISVPASLKTGAGEVIRRAYYTGEPTPVIVYWKWDHDSVGMASAISIFPVEGASAPALKERGFRPLSQSELLTGDLQEKIKGSPGVAVRLDWEVRVEAVAGPADSESTAFYDYVALREQVIWLPGDTLNVQVQDTSSAGGGRQLPVEEAIMPPWVSDEYKNANIGDKIYLPFFGCSSIVDAIKGHETYDDLSTHSVEQAVDQIAMEYSIHTNSGRTQALSYTRSFSRPVATFPDVLYPKGWHISQAFPEGDGYVVSTWTVLDTADASDPEKVKMSGGFHSGCVSGTSLEFGNALEYLDIVGKRMSSRMSLSEKDTISEAEAEKLDPRAERASRVIRYRTAIRGASALKSLGSVTGDQHVLPGALGKVVGIGRLG